MSPSRPLATKPLRGWLWAGLLCALLGSQWLALLHAQLHPGGHAGGLPPAFGHAGHAGHAGHPVQGASRSALPPEPGDASGHGHEAHAEPAAQGVGQALLELFDQHEIGSAACQLLDQLGHAAPYDGLALLTPPSWDLPRQAACARVEQRSPAWARPPARAPPSRA